MLSRRNRWMQWIGLGALCLGGVGCACCKRPPAIRGQNPCPSWPPPPAPVQPLPMPPAATLSNPVTAAPQPQPTPTPTPAAIASLQPQAAPVTPKQPAPTQSAANVPAPSVDSAIPAAAPAQPATAAPSAPATDPAAKVREIYALAAQSYAGIDGYTAQLRRREVVNGDDKPEELMLFKFRKQPWSVAFKWIGPEANGRELVFVKGRYNNELHTLLGPGEKIPFMPRKMSLSPDSPFVRGRSRHDINEAGIGHIIEQFGGQLNSPQAHLLRYAGTVKQAEYPQPLDTIEQTIPPGGEPQLPRGGRRLISYDPVSHLPVQVVTRDDRNRQVEFYLYEHIQFPVALTDNDFNPERLGVASR